MEEYSNEGLSILIKGLERQISKLEKKHDDGILALQKCIFGNGKVGIFDSIIEIKSWKRGITMVLGFLTVVILPIGFIVIKELISKYK